MPIALRQPSSQGLYAPGGTGGSSGGSDQTGSVAIVDGQQSYAVVFSPAFASKPSYFDASVEMPSSVGEVFAISYSDLDENGCTVWLSGVPTAASDGGFINWSATE